jgi:rubrerythrin
VWLLSGAGHASEPHREIRDRPDGKRKEMLRQLGKITRAEITDAEVNDMPPRYRLACQCFVRNEDIIVTFEGDETVPAQGPHITHAAKRFTGGLQIETLDEFLGFAVKVEEDAAIHFDEIAASMAAVGNQEVASLFRQLAGFSRLHYAEAKSRAGSIDLAAVIPPEYVWPNHATPERTSLWAGDSALTRVDALKAALQGEKRGYEFYVSVAATTKSEEVATMAREFVKEEAERVAILQAWITREEWAIKNATITENA